MLNYAERGKQMSYGARIREIRKSRGIGSAFISRAMGKYDGWLSRVERGHLKLSVEEVPPMAKLLGCAIDSIFLPPKVTDCKHTE
jgi:transcriptional regulator with XRE-family HTH domain